MHKRAGLFLLVGASVAAVAANNVVGPIQLRGTPAVEQAGLVPLPVAVQAAQQMAAPPFAGNISSEIARWRALRGSDNQPFSAYASFLASHRGWPGEAAMRRAAERQLDPATTSAREALRFFNDFPPLTAAGHAKLALALQAEGRADEARAAARTAWTMGVMPQDVEQRLLGALGGTFTPADHDRRMDVLLGNGDTQSAQRTLGWASAERRPVYEARIALQTRAPNARELGMALGQSVAGDAGFLIDRANWQRANGDSVGARQLLAQRRSLAGPPAAPEKFMEAKVAIARGAAADRQWSTVWQIASQVDDIYPAGTDISRLSFGERDQFTNLTWLAGTAALQQLGRPADAVAMFERYGRAAQSPQTLTKGLYWAGRAAQQAGQQDRARALFAEAGRHFDQFYGQLSLDRLGQPLPAPNRDGPPQPSAAERNAFNQNSLVQAIRFLGANASWRDQTEFVRALSTSVSTDAERLMAVELGQQIGRVDLGVLVARRARSDGSFDYKRWGFPELNVPASQRHNWAIVHAITRQESLFDREAVSHAGARGLMQLMPGTAREQAGMLGLPYDMARLTRDTDYNVMLGSTYFARLLNQWGGNFPLAVASYNAGAGNVRRWVNQFGDPRLPHVDTVEWIEQIPFQETRNYVQRVLENAVVYDLMRPDRAGSPERNRLSFYLGQQSRPG